LSNPATHHRNLAEPVPRADPKRRRHWELMAAATFVVVHLTSPFWIGELYPFTISPMFCDSPKACCEYELFATDQTPIDAKQFNLHMVYDGNPPGLGMGIVADPTLHEFGEIGTEQEVTRHIRKVLDQLNSAGADCPDQIVVHQHHYFSADHQIKHEVNVWTVDTAENGE